MKRIVLIILILINLFVLGLILLKIDNVQENFSSNCNSLPDKLTVNVGSSGSNVKTIRNIQNLSCYNCPSFVNKTKFYISTNFL